MNDLHWIKYIPARMYIDTSDMSGNTERAHRRLCDFLWLNDGPPLNNEDALRQVTHCEPGQWAKVKGELMAKGWYVSGKYFTHRGATKSLNESKMLVAENHNKTAKANRKPILEAFVRDADSGVMDLRENHDVPWLVTPSVTPPVTDGHSESDIGRELKKDFPPSEDVFKGVRGESSPLPEIPTLAEATAQTASAGIPPDFVEFVHRDWSSRSGKDASGVVVAWLPYVTKRWARECNEWRAGTHRGRKSVAAQPASIGPALAEVKAYARDKCSPDKAMNVAVSFHRHWTNMQWKKQGKPIDWKVEFAATAALNR